MKSEHVEIRPAAAEDIPRIAQNARQADIDELWASGRSTPAAAMEGGLARSTHAWTGWVDGVPVCMFGAVPVGLLSGAGVPWMIGSKELDRKRVQKALLANTKPMIAQMTSVYPVLINWVDARNKAAHRWLKWTGFKLFDPEPLGPDKVPFMRFEMRSGDDV